MWIDATEDVECIEAQIKTLLANRPVENAEEVLITEYEGFEGYTISETECIQDVHDIACFIQDRGKLGAALLHYECGNVNSAIRTMEDQYTGCYASLTDFAQDLIESCTEIPSELEGYIDYEKMGRDLEYCGDIFTIKTAHDEVHVFWSR